MLISITIELCCSTAGSKSCWFNVLDEIVNSAILIGTFEDGSGTDNYNNNVGCSFNIAVSGSPGSGKVVVISVLSTFMDIEGGYDFISVVGVGVTHSGSGQFFRQKVVPQDVAAGMTVQFTTDGSETRPGWTLQYVVLTCTPCPSGGTAPAGSTASSACTIPPCGPGTTGSPGVCTDCEADTYKDSTGSAACMPCPSGSTSPPGSASWGCTFPPCGPGTTGSTLTPLAATPQKANSYQLSAKANFYQHQQSGAEVEFGNNLWIGETGEGYIVDYLLEKQKTSDAKQIVPAIGRLVQAQHLAVARVWGDRGLHSADNEKFLKEARIYSGLCPKNVSELAERLENDEGMREGLKRRAGTEARISIIIRDFMGKPARAKGFKHREMMVGWAVMSHNLWVLARQPRRSSMAEAA